MKYILVILLTFFSMNSFAKSGVLILAHGSMQMETMGCNTQNPSKWEQAVLDSVKSIKSELKLEVEVAFGMWNTKCFDMGINRLTRKLGGLDHLYVLPLFISSHSAVIEMQKFIFFKRTDRAIPIPTVNRVNYTKKITYLSAIDYNPQVSFILANRMHNLIHDAKALGYKKDQMELVLVMHGPVSDKDNIEWMGMGNKYVQDINYLFPTAAQHVISLRDDAADTVRDAATKELRAKLAIATRKGGIALVLPLLLSKGGIEQGILDRMQGLSYVWRGNMLLPDTKLNDLLKNRINSL